MLGKLTSIARGNKDRRTCRPNSILIRGLYCYDVGHVYYQSRYGNILLMNSVICALLVFFGT